MAVQNIMDQEDLMASFSSSRFHDEESELEDVLIGALAWVQSTKSPSELLEHADVIGHVGNDNLKGS